MHQHQHKEHTHLQDKLRKGALAFTSLAVLAGTIGMIPLNAEASDYHTPHAPLNNPLDIPPPDSAPVNTAASAGSDSKDVSDSADLIPEEEFDGNATPSTRESIGNVDNAPDNASHNTPVDINTENLQSDPAFSNTGQSENTNSLETHSDNNETAAEKSQSGDDPQSFDLSSVDEVLPISILQRTPLTPGSGFRSARAATADSPFLCSDNSVYNMQADGKVRRVDATSKSEETEFISASPIVKKTAFRNSPNRQVNAFAINTEGTAAFAVENGSYPVPECDNIRFDAQHRSDVCATRNTETWFRFLTWTKEQGWGRLQIGNRSFIRQNELPGYNAYVNSAGGNRRVLNQSVGAWNPRLNRYYFGFYGDRSRTRNMELYLYWLTPTSRRLEGPLIIDATTHFSGNELPPRDDFINGDIMFDTAGNLYAAMSTENRYKLIGINQQYIASAGSNTRLADAQLFVAKTDGALKTENLVSGLAFRSDGAVVFNALNALEAYNPQTGLKLSAQKEGEDGTYRLSRPIPSRNDTNSLRTDMASCAQPTTLAVRKNVVSWAQAGQKDTFTLTAAREREVLTPFGHITTSAPAGDGLGIQNGTIGPMPIFLTNKEDEEGQIVLKEFLGQSEDVYNKYDAEWICESSNGTRLGPVAADVLNLNLKNSKLKGSAITCTVANTKKLDTPPKPFVCDADTVYTMEDWDTNRIIEIPKLGSNRQPREYITGHIRENLRHNALGISGDGSYAMAIEMNEKEDNTIHEIRIKKFDGRRWSVLPVDGSTEAIKVGRASYRAWQGGAINPADSQYYFGYWKPRTWEYKPYPVEDKFGVFELFYYDETIKGGAIKHVASIKTNYSPEKQAFGRFPTLDDNKEKVKGINGDITFDKKGNLYILASSDDHARVFSILSGQVQNAKQKATRYYHRNNNVTVGNENNYTDFFKQETTPCQDKNGETYTCYSMRKDPSRLTQLSAHAVGNSDIHADGETPFRMTANGIAFRNDGTLFINSTRVGAAYAVAPWGKVEEAPAIPHPDGEYNLSFPPNGTGRHKLFGDGASCNAPTTFLLRKNLPQGRYDLADQFEIRMVQTGAPESTALVSTTRGTETGLQVESAFTENENYTSAEWIGAVPLVDQRSYTFSENLAATSGNGDAAARKRELRRKYTSHVDCALDGDVDGFNGTPIPAASRQADEFGIELKNTPLAGKQIVCTFTNIPRPVITWDKVNEAGDLLPGSEWTLTEKLTPGANSDDTKPLGGTGKVTLTDCAVGAGKKCPEPAEGTLADVDPVAGKFRLEGARYGTYTLVEKTAPRGYSKLNEDAIAPLTISLPDFTHKAPRATPEAHTFQTNPKLKNKVVNKKAPGVLKWTKVAAATQIRLTGSEWTLSSTQVTNFQPLKIRDCVAPNACQGTNDANPAPGEFTVENLTQGNYTLKETEAPAGYVIAVDTHGNPVTHPVVVDSDTTHIGLIENEQRPQVSIPLTGGMSADAFLIAGGTALGVSALAAIVMLRRRRVTNSPPAQQ